jgi:hypothetical protein
MAISREGSEIVDISDSDESLSSVPSSALNSPPQELAMHMGKRSLGGGDNNWRGVRENKKLKQ